MRSKKTRATQFFVSVLPSFRDTDTMALTKPTTAMTAAIEAATAAQPPQREHTPKRQLTFMLFAQGTTERTLVRPLVFRNEMRLNQRPAISQANRHHDDNDDD